MYERCKQSTLKETSYVRRNEERESGMSMYVSLRHVDIAFLDLTE